MVQHKAQLKKHQKRGVDFKKIKRKVGRKLPPPKNATNTEVKSKAIILPEQSVASDKAGLAVSKKGLTLKELLQQTSHHNAKVRRDALIGIRDIFLKHPAELKLHRLSVIEKLRERISDDDKMVRETLYQLLKAVIFPACKEDNQGPFVSLMMAYVFNAMTHLAVDVRLTAFKFLDLIVQHYPSSFSLYAEKILRHYKEMLQKNQFNFHDKGKLKSILAGLAYCLSLMPCSQRDENSSIGNVVADRKILHSFGSDVSEVHSGFCATKELKDLLPILISALQDLMPSVHTTVTPLEAQSFDCALSILRSVDFVVKFFVNGKKIGGERLKVSPPDRGDQAVLQLLLKKLFDVFPLKATHLSEKDESRYFVLNVIVSEMFFCLRDWNTPPSALLDKYLEFLGNALSEKVSISVHSGKAFFHKHAISLIPFIPKLIMQVEGTWKLHILQAFTEVFKKCDPESSMKLACLSAIDEMLFPKHGWQSPNKSDSEYLDFQITWIRELPSLLILLGDKNPVSSKAVLGLQLRMGQCAFMNPSLLQEFDNMQYSLREFFSTCLDGSSLYGPFMRLARDIQEISVSCLYYLSFMDPLLLQSLVTCCLCQEMEPFLLFRILEVLDSAYRAGHIRIADYISFLITLLARYEVIPGSSSLTMKKCGKSNSGTFKSVTGAICSFLSQIGDGCLVFQMLEKAVIDQISNKPPTENVCALLRVLITLDSRPTKISEESISELGNALPGYLIDIVSRLSEEDHESSNNVRTRKSHYYLLPCFLLFYGSNKLINRVLNVMRYFISEDASPAFLHQGHHCTADHSSWISSVVYVLVLLHEDVRLRQILLLCKEEIDSILQDILGIMSREGNNLSIEEKHKIQHAYDRLKTFIGR